MKPPCFCLWSVESSSQCKYHCSARIDLGSVQILRPCCYFCLQWKCTLQWHLQQKCSHILLIAWEKPLRNDFYTTSQPSSLREAFSRQIKSWDTFAGGEVAPWKTGCDFHRWEQQGPGDWGWNIYFWVWFFYTSLLDPLSVDVAIPWGGMVWGKSVTRVWSGQGAPGDFLFLSKQDLQNIFTFIQKSPFLESCGIKWYLGSMY